jgi:hypothetical protein
MNTRNLLSVLAFGGVVALVACSSDDADKFGTTDSFCAAKADAECNNIAVQKCGATVDACKPLRQAQCSSDASTAQSQGRSYVSGAVQDCLDSINDTYGSGGSHVTPLGETATANVCDRVFRGSKTENQACANTGECSGSLICDTLCATEQPASIGQGCGNAGQVCDAATSYCQDQGGKKFCAALEADGNICDPVMAPCVTTDRCVNHCIAKETVGQACNVDSDCADAAPFCDTTATPHKCRPKYESTSPACKTYGSGG